MFSRGRMKTNDLGKSEGCATHYYRSASEVIASRDRQCNENSGRQYREDDFFELQRKVKVSAATFDCRTKGNVVHAS